MLCSKEYVVHEFSLTLKLCYNESSYYTIQNIFCLLIFFNGFELLTNIGKFNLFIRFI